MIEHPAHLLHPNLEKHWHDHTAGPPPEGGVRGGRNPWWAMAAIAPAILICAFDMTTLNVALADLTRSLHANTSDLQWILDSYTIVLAGLLLFAQGLADRYGRKGIYLIGLAIFGLSSFAAAFTTTPTELILARSMMGVGAALLLSPTLAMIAVIYPPKQRGRAVAIWVIFGGVGVALGPILGGFLVDAFGWGAAFLVNVPVTIIAIVLSAIILPTSRRPGEVELDVVGMLLSIIGLSVLLYGVIEGPHLGWGSPKTLGAIAIGAGVTVAFFVWESRSKSPMFHPSVFRHSGVIAGAMVLFAIYFTFLGMLFLVPQYFQFVLGDTAFVAGALMLPFGIAFILAAQAVPKMTKHFGVRMTLMVGMGGSALGLFALSLLSVDANLVPVMLGSVLFGAGIGMSVGPATIAVVNSLPIEEAGDGSSVNMLMRQVGAAFGVAALGSIFAGIYAAQIDPIATKVGGAAGEAVSRSLQGAEAAAAAAGGATKKAIDAAAESAFVAGAKAGLLVAAGFALVTVIVVAVALRENRGAPASMGSSTTPVDAGA